MSVFHWEKKMNAKRIGEVFLLVSSTAVAFGLGLQDEDLVDATFVDALEARPDLKLANVTTDEIDELLSMTMRQIIDVLHGG